MPLDFDTFPLREIRKGRELQWNPHTIDLHQDRSDWKDLTDAERTVILLEVFGFLVGERAVAHDLAPLQQALRREGRHMEEEMYLTQQQFEEATHVEFFQRWLYEVLPGRLGEDIPYPPGEPSRVLRKILPAAMTALTTDMSRSAQLYATTVYHQIVEGVLAEVGYQVFYDCLDDRGILPGLREGVRNIQVDESRHIAFGTYLARRIIRDEPNLRDRFTEWMEELRPASVESASSFFDEFEEPYPFGLSRTKNVVYCEALHKRRLEAVLSEQPIEA